MRDFAFLIETGVIALSVERTTGDFHIAGPGDYVGLGYLEHYTDTATCLSSAIVTLLDTRDIDALAADAPTLAKHQADAVERQFEARKQHLVGADTKNPVRRVAGLLLCLSRQNVLEGRQPDVVADCMACGAVSNLLGIDIDTLEHALVHLREIGVISATADHAIRLNSLDVLEVIADPDCSDQEKPQRY